MKDIIQQVEALIESNRAAGIENSYWHGVLDGLLHASDPARFNLATKHSDLLTYGTGV